MVLMISAATTKTSIIPTRAKSSTITARSKTPHHQNGGKTMVILPAMQSGIPRLEACPELALESEAHLHQRAGKTLLAQTHYRQNFASQVTLHHLISSSTRTELRHTFPSTDLGKSGPENSVGILANDSSRNKSPPDGYRLSRVEFDPTTGQPVEAVTSTNAATNIMYNANTAQCPNRCFRPVNVAWGPNGQLFMTSDTTNEIWVIGGAT